jgi:DMSO/TMAO reductase YedYZ molybdopterin-dependent catalytic subunit
MRVTYRTRRERAQTPSPRKTPAHELQDMLFWAGGLAAALSAGLAMWLFRSMLQVRSAPERVLEWLLLFVPLDLFESLLQRFGFSAKSYALYLAILLMLAVLAWLGAVALRRGWSLGTLAGLGLGMWLFAMLVIMPATSAGAFASDLLEGTRSTILGYLVVGLVYSTVLMLVRVFVLPPRADATIELLSAAGVDVPPRRLALSLLGGSGAVLAFTFVLDALFPHRTGLPTIVVADPQEPVRSGGLAEPNPHPNGLAPLVPVAAPPTVAAEAPAPTATPRSSLPEPGNARTLSRDQDGAVQAAARRPGELPEALTSNENFYIVTKNAGGDPVLHPDDWRVVVDGEVQRPFELDYAALRKLPSVEITRTLECISNLVDKCQLAPFGCDLISTARWKGVRLSDILGLVGGVKPGVGYVATISADEFTTALPIDVAMSPDTLLVYEMNGKVLPREHGYPARILVPGRYGMKNAKWVVALRPMQREFVDWYGQRSWSHEALVKTMSRIDVPAAAARLQAGSQRIAGVAYAGDRGIQKIEFSADGGETWQDADLIEPAGGRDAWVRWQSRFTIGKGDEVTLISRATDGRGELQIEQFSLAQPDGAAGWNTIMVRGS